MQMYLLQNGELLPKSHVFQKQVATRTKESGNKTRQKSKQADPPTSLHTDKGCSGTRCMCQIWQEISLWRATTAMKSAGTILIGLHRSQVTSTPKPYALPTAAIAMTRPLSQRIQFS